MTFSKWVKEIEEPALAWMQAKSLRAKVLWFIKYGF